MSENEIAFLCILIAIVFYGAGSIVEASKHMGYWDRGFNLAKQIYHRSPDASQGGRP